MTTKTLDCPIIGLTYTECVDDFGTFYTFAPDADHKMRVRSMDTADEEGNTVPCYGSMLSHPRPYDFDTNPMGIEAEPA